MTLHDTEIFVEYFKNRICVYHNFTSEKTMA